MPYSRGAGMDVRWVVIEGDEPFFRVTKRLHNMLHGAHGDGAGLQAADEAAYLAVAGRNARELTRLVRPGDLVLAHDPRPRASLRPFARTGRASYGAATSGRTSPTTTSTTPGRSCCRMSRRPTGSSSPSWASRGRDSTARVYS